MFLKSLTISSGLDIIREIKFRLGINLIVDETPNIQGKETGNNVGKTTVLMLIDFCLGANPNHIYTDPENKKDIYKRVKDFLVENNIVVTLVLKEDLEVESSPEIRIERNFLSRSKIIRSFNGVAKTEDAFEEALTNYFFPEHYGKKPTFRQIISHNIRYKDMSINNTLKTLDAYTSDAEYETLYLFLLGCDFEHGDRKQELLSDIRTEQSFKSRLEEGQTKSAYESALAILENEIIALDAKKFSFDLNNNFEQDLVNLNNIKYKINFLSSEIGKLNIRKNLIVNAKNDLSENQSKIDLNLLKQIYNQASSQINQIQKSFEDLCNFHNRMIAEKIRYIAKDLPEIEKQLISKSDQMSRFREEEKLLTSKVAKSDSLEELEKIISELNDKYRSKGEYENILEKLKTSESKLADFNQQLTTIDDDLFSDTFESNLKTKVNKFNNHFSNISQALYGEKYALKPDQVVNSEGQRLYKFSAFNTNFSSGKKQGEISCFDIAYTLYADEEDIPCLHFLLNDKKELMHDNQLLNIANLVESKKLQFVASILKDKLPEELNKEEYFVVKLSQTDKLFRIESFGIASN